MTTSVDCKFLVTNGDETTTTRPHTLTMTTEMHCIAFSISGFQLNASFLFLPFFYRLLDCMGSRNGEQRTEVYVYTHEAQFVMNTKLGRNIRREESIPIFASLDGKQPLLTPRYFLFVLFFFICLYISYSILSFTTSLQALFSEHGMACVHSMPFLVVNETQAGLCSFLVLSIIFFCFFFFFSLVL